MTIGPYRVLPFAKGGVIVYDERRPIGERTVKRYATVAEARAALLGAKERHEERARMAQDGRSASGRD